MAIHYATYRLVGAVKFDIAAVPSTLKRSPIGTGALPKCFFTLSLRSLSQPGPQAASLVVIREHEYFVEWNGRPVKSVKTAFKTALRLAMVSGRISPHTLRHTAATWLMQNAVDKCEAAGFLGMSVEMLDRVCGHHHPECLRGAAHALGYRRSQSLAITLAPGRRPRLPDRQPVGNAGGGRSRFRTRLHRLTGKLTGNFVESGC